MARKIEKLRYEEIRLSLVARRLALLTAVQGNRRSEVARCSEGKEVLDMEEEAQTGVENDVRYELLRRKAREILQIETALARIEAGTFGHCSGCGGEIAEARLKANLSALQCRECQEKDESGEVKVIPRFQSNFSI